jgi:hemerythrin-like domain-containing protein
METAALEALNGQSGRERTIADNALAYAALLREHIAKEDEILYPLAERVIPDIMRDEIIAGYAAAEARQRPISPLLTRRRSLVTNRSRRKPPRF